MTAFLSTELQVELREMTESSSHLMHQSDNSEEASHAEKIKRMISGNSISISIVLGFS